MKTTQSSLTIVAILIAVFALTQITNAQTATWSGLGADQNWSTPGNWTPAGGGSAPPAAGDTAIFGAGAFPASTNVAGAVNNIVSASTTVGGLQYINTTAAPSHHTTQINTGQTLTVNGTFGEGVATLTTVAAMTGTGNFTVNNIAGNFNVGGAGISTATVTLTLADGTNTINVNTLSLGESASNNGRQCIINLGAGTNIINANTINMGTGKGLGNITWLPATTTGGLTIRNAAGTGRATMLLGNGTSGSGGSRGNLLLAGHRGDVLAGTMTIGRVGNDTANQIGVVTVDDGIVDATSILMGVVPATGVPTGGGASTGNTINIGGNAATAATLIVNSPSGPGGGSFIISDSVNTSAHVGSATFNLNQNGTAQVYCPITKTQATLNTATINITGGTLNMEAAANTIGTPSVPIDNLTLDTATLQFSEDGSALNASVINLTMNNETNVVNIAALPPIVSLPTQIPIMTYATFGGTFNMGVSNMPGDYHGYVTNDGVSTIYLVITSGTVVVAKQDRWSGAVNTNWDVSTLNWTNAGVAVAYSEGDFVTFDDTANTGNVTLVGNQHTPSSVTVTNNVLNYTFSGPGRIFGTTSLVKWGSASLTLTESGGDSFAGGIIVHGGTMVLDSPNSAIPGGLTNDVGTVVQIGNNDGNGVLPSGFLQINGSLVFNQASNRTVAAVISGSGSVTKSGSNTLTLTGVSAYTGNTTVAKGTLVLSGSGSISSSPLTSVQNATLDLTPATSPSFTTLTLTNGTLNVGAGTNSPNGGAFSVSNSTVILIADYNNVGGSAVLPTTSFTSGGTTNMMNITSIRNLPLSPPLPFSIPLISYATFNGNFNIGWTNLPGISGSISNNVANSSIDLVITGAPQNITWNGGSATVNNWSDAANWSGTPISALDALTFDGNVRVNTTNDTAAGTTYVGITFNSGAAPFTLNGAPINLTGTTVNNSPNIQTVNLGIAVNSAATLDGGASGGSFVINGGVTNTSAAGQTVTLLGAGTLGDRLATIGGQLVLSVGGIGSDWTIVDSTGSSALVQSGNAQLNVAVGQLDFGTNNSAPNVDLGITTNGSVTINGGTGGTFNMNNGTLRANSMTVASSGTVAGVVNVNGGTVILGNGAFAATGGNGASTMAMTITNGSIYSTNGGNFTIAQRGASTVTLTGGLLQCGNLVPATGQTAGGNGVVNLNGGTLICTNVSVGSAGANAWGTVNYNGGTLKPGTNSATFFTRLNLALLTNQVQVGGAIIDTAGFSTAFNLPLISDPALGGSPDGGLTKLGAGTLTLSAANTYNGNTTVSGGTLLVSGSLDVGDVNVGANGTLAGSGTIGGQVTVNGTIAPGTTAATGKLTVLSNVTLNAISTNVMKLNQTGATNDVLVVSSNLVYGGTLSLTNLSGTLTASSTFKLFNAGTYSGAFARLLPATPGFGLGWNTNTLTTDGILRVVATVNTTPTNITAVVSGNHLNLSWPADHTGWRLQVQTNTVNVGLRSNWVDVVGSTTVNSISVTINPANGSVFFRMVYP